MALMPPTWVVLYLLGVMVVALFYGRWPSWLPPSLVIIEFRSFYRPRRSLISDVSADLRVILAVGLIRNACWRALSGAGSHYREQRTAPYEASKLWLWAMDSQDITATSERLLPPFHAVAGVAAGSSKLRLTSAGPNELSVSAVGLIKAWAHRRAVYHASLPLKAGERLPTDWWWNQVCADDDRNSAC